MQGFISCASSLKLVVVSSQIVSLSVLGEAVMRERDAQFDNRQPCLDQHDDVISVPDPLSNLMPHTNGSSLCRLKPTSKRPTKNRKPLKLQRVSLKLYPQIDGAAGSYQRVSTVNPLTVTPLLSR